MWIVCDHIRHTTEAWNWYAPHPFVRSWDNPAIKIQIQSVHANHVNRCHLRLVYCEISQVSYHKIEAQRFIFFIDVCRRLSQTALDPCSRRQAPTRNRLQVGCKDTNYIWTSQRKAQKNLRTAAKSLNKVKRRRNCRTQKGLCSPKIVPLQLN